MEDFGLFMFTADHGIYPGVNAPQFMQLEYLVHQEVIPNIGLFGEASTGKTTAVSVLKTVFHGGRAKIVSLLGTSLTLESLNSQVVEMLKEKRNLNPSQALIDSREEVYSVWGYDKLIIFIDEAHDMPKKLQTQLLTVFDRMKEEPKSAFINSSTRDFFTFSLKNAFFILATTDTSRLIYPLVTRLQSVTFDQYSKDDIQNIIYIKYPTISEEAREVLANCSKLVPRVACRLAEQLTSFHKGVTMIDKEQAILFAKNFLNMEENGIDSIDKRILLYLANHKKKIEPVDLISLNINKENKERLEKKMTLTNSERKDLNRATFQVAILENKISTAEFTPKSRQDISLACRILDLNDLEARLTFLEKLSLVDKTPQGILLNEKYL